MFQKNAHRTRHTGYFLLIVEIKDYNVVTDGRNFFDQSVKNVMRTCKNTRKVTIGQRSNYFIDYPYLKEDYKLIS